MRQTRSEMHEEKEFLKFDDKITKLNWVLQSNNSQNRQVKGLVCQRVTKDVRAQFGLVGCITSLRLAGRYSSAAELEQGHFSTHALDRFTSCYHIAHSTSRLLFLNQPHVIASRALATPSSEQSRRCQTCCSQSRHRQATLSPA
jgi:hypothetical protein